MADLNHALLRILHKHCYELKYLYHRYHRPPCITPLVAKHCQCCCQLVLFDLLMPLCCASMCHLTPFTAHFLACVKCSSLCTEGMMSLFSSSRILSDGRCVVGLGRDTISPGQTVQWSFAESDNEGTSNKTAEPVHSYHTQKQQTVLKEAVETIGITFNDDIWEREGERGEGREN